MKKIVSLVLAISMVLSMFVSAFAATTFEDVDNTKYAGAVEALVELGVINGLPDGTYGPEKEVTRAELAKMLVICLGLGDSVEALAGKTVFTDVADNHWASGYINAAVQSKIIAGYPDGTFKPEKEVTYAEAYTMMLRALGYGNVVDAEGTWPTAYMLKAVELKLDEDVEDDKAGNAALRGNVAIMLWNMLRTNMWRIGSENEGTGMTSTTGEPMLNIKFPDYNYDTTEFAGYEIVAGDEEAEVKLSFVGDSTDYLYDGLDFHTFVPGTEVEILVNEKEEVLLSIVPTSENKLVEGAKDVLDEDYDELKEVAYDYAYALVERKAIDDAAILSGDSIVVDKLDVKDDYVRIKVNKYENDDWDYELVVKDGERASLSDLEVGDVLTTVNVTYLDGTEADPFYVIGSETEEGELTRYAEVSYENSDLTFEQMTVSKEKYVVAAGATYVEDPEAKTIKAKALTGNAQADEMEGEDVELVLDVTFGKVVRVNFDGKIDSGNEEETTIAFYGVTAGVDKDGRTYNIQLENEEGSDTYDFAKNSDAETEAKAAYANGTDLTGHFVWAELDDEGNIVTLVDIADYSGDVDNFENVVYGEEAEDEYYAVVEMLTAKYDDEKNAISGEELVKVNDSTVLVTLVFDDKGTTKESDDEYRVEFAEGLEALEDVKDEHVLVIYDADSSFVRAKYVVVWSDTSDKTGNQVAKVVSPDENTVYVGGELIDLEDADGEEMSATIADGTKDLSAYELVVYTITTNSKGKDIFNFIAGLNTDELTASNTNHGYVGETNGDRVFLLDGEEVDIDDEEYEEYQDFMIVVVDVTESEENEDQYEVSGFETVDFEDVVLSEGDRISISEEEEVIFLISGMPVREEAEVAPVEE